MINLLFLLFFSHSASAGTWCSWNDASYGGWARLRLPGTDVPYASVNGDRITTTAQLQPGVTGPTLRVAMRQGGVSVRGDIDTSEGLVLRAGLSLPLNGVGFIAEGAPVEPVQLMTDGSVLVRGSPAAMAGVKLMGLGGAPLSCAQLLLSGRFNRLSESEALAASLGVTDQTETRYLRHGRIPLRPAPGARRGAVLTPLDYEREVAVLERRGGQARIALSHYDGVVWTGWVRERDLMDAELEPVDGVGGILGSLGHGELEKIYACDAVMPLRARVGDQETEVGAIAAGTPFKVLASVEGGVHVGLDRAFVFPETDVKFLLPAEAAACPFTERPAMGLEQLFKEGP